ncbi:SAM and PH domain-containing protein [Aspergillus ibericus CBS 121593]|uniref:SAM and PH domain protein n=1 Tax=Aspergillus ibericus CBS 121593 TaxID=1448316 RepID=A0A395HBQ3_9EURO|nr:hypothetical protein BO80DRAFT_431502 [Aspergillus ibericus CBS 121593]RAL04933.1 hypothetical protein BO80DRAFT_431502 [Aspergillus ibericus CBS 121593]
MDTRRTRRKAPPASLDMTNTKKFQPAFTVVKARQSATTDFDDTDFEYSESDDESPRMSMGSFGYDSVSSASTPELPTPDHAPRGPFDYYRKSTQGPSGPHLFRSSIASASSVPSTEIDLYFERSPRRSQFQSDLDTPQFPPSDVETPLPTDVETLYTGSNLGSARFPRSHLGTPYYPPSDSEAPPYTGSSVASSQFSRSKLGTSCYPASDIEAPQYTGSSVASSQFPRSNFGNSHYPASDLDVPQHTGSSIGGKQFPRSDVGTPNYPPSDIEAPQYTGSSVASSQFSKSNFAAPQYSASDFEAPQHTGSSIGSTQFPRSDVSSSRKYAFSPCTPEAYRTVHPDVSQVEESEIRGWSPSQVAHWMHIAGYDESVIDRFIINDIAGNVLLNLRADDLKELGIQSFGKRHQLMASIDHLRNTMMKDQRPRDRDLSMDRESSRNGDLPRRQSYTASISPTGEVISREPNGNQLTETEAVSIVGIEQVLPKPHNCSKGEGCPKYRRYMRQMEKLAAEYPDAILVPGQSIVTGNPGNPQTAPNMLRPKSDTEPSVVASSDVLGVVTPRLSEEALNEIRKLDPQEKMRQYFSYQHLEHSSDSDSDSDSDTSPAPAVPPKVAPNEAGPILPPPATRTNNMTANLRSLPKLVIPTDSDSDDLTTAVTTQRTITPSMASQMYGSPTVVQEYGPFSNARNIPPADYYRQGTPFTEVDVPVTAQMDGPIARETSQSVPPDMRYGNVMRARYPGPISRSPSVRAHPGMALRRVKENKPLTPIDDPADLKRSPRIGCKTGNNSSVAKLDPDVTRSGYMKKRKPARFLRHDWQEAHFTLRGTNLAMHRDEYAALRRSRALEEIDVEEYAVACSALASSSKLTAAFKKSILRNGNNPGKGDAAFTFSLVPASKENEKKMLFGNKDIKSHHFAVRTRDERIDWMRDMMLAKALKKGREDGYEMRPEGNFI